MVIYGSISQIKDFLKQRGYNLIEKDNGENSIEQIE